MTMSIRKQLSLAAWGGAFFCSCLLLLSAQAAVHHYQSSDKSTEKTYTVTVPSISAPN